MKKVDDEESGGSKKKETRKKDTKKKELEHTHGLTSPVPGDGCELCETHGEAFEMPEYEIEMEMDDRRDDPDWELEEEDFDDID